jgi:hypothetical protein
MVKVLLLLCTAIGALPLMACEPPASAAPRIVPTAAPSTSDVGGPVVAVMAGPLPGAAPVIAGSRAHGTCDAKTSVHSPRRRNASDLEYTALAVANGRAKVDADGVDVTAAPSQAIKPCILDAQHHCGAGEAFLSSPVARCTSDKDARGKATRMSCTISEAWHCADPGSLAGSPAARGAAR